MGEHLTLSTEEYDTIRELINIGIGKAASGLSEMTDSKIRLTIPEIIIKSKQEVENSLPETKTPFSAAHLGIKGDYKGNGILLFSKENAKKLTHFLMDEDDTEEDIVDTIKEVANITINAVVGSMCNTLGKNISFNIPTYINTPDELNNSSLIPDNSLCLQAITLFKIAELEINGNILIHLSDEAVKDLKNDLRNLNKK